ncbi:pyridoxamine 5'-phosphate oxidase family protein [Celeribacter arenosi]|uniref:Pyridoxamine 5'-phosphate oxidase family protein n=1 Tax=Celeribacter arenosi TaxID=792649 RepID=A0ABP7K0C3_9RHOB
MADQFDQLSHKHQDFITRQHIFFVGSAAPEARVNITPRSTEHLRIAGPAEVLFLDLTGSSNETAAHMRADGRLTLMFCAFEGPPLILRLYGRGRAVRYDAPQFATLWETHFGGEIPKAARQIFVQSIDLVQTSCGFGVPAFQYERERPALRNWAAKKSRAEIESYWREKNVTSIDGLPTGLFDDV